jgi:hypothetical protein
MCTNLPCTPDMSSIRIIPDLRFKDFFLRMTRVTEAWMPAGGSHKLLVSLVVAARQQSVPQTDSLSSLSALEATSAWTLAPRPRRHGFLPGRPPLSRRQPPPTPSTSEDRRPRARLSSPPPAASPPLPPGPRVAAKVRTFAFCTRVRR